MVACPPTLSLFSPATADAALKTRVLFLSRGVSSVLSGKIPGKKHTVPGANRGGQIRQKRAV